MSVYFCCSADCMRLWRLCHSLGSYNTPCLFVLPSTGNLRSFSGHSGRCVCPARCRTDVSTSLRCIIFQAFSSCLPLPFDQAGISISLRTGSLASYSLRHSRSDLSDGIQAVVRNCRFFIESSYSELHLLQIHLKEHLRKGSRTGTEEEVKIVGALHQHPLLLPFSAL